jgi:hypothetical protein
MREPKLAETEDHCPAESLETAPESTTVTFTKCRDCAALAGRNQLEPEIGSVSEGAEPSDGRELRLGPRAEVKPTKPKEGWANKRMKHGDNSGPIPIELYAAGRKPLRNVVP